MRRITFFILLMLTMALSASAQNLKAGRDLPAVPTIPEVDSPKQNGSVPLGDINTFREIQLDIPICDGPFKPSWESIEQNYPGTPAWLREAKFGIWVHFGPQAAGESGDWYARKLYNETTPAYQNHLKRYGHPSEVGYKDVLNKWNPDKFDPEALTKLYQKAGARFLLIQGVHHDNYDLWNSQYQPWNSSATCCASGLMPAISTICAMASPSITNIPGGGGRQLLVPTRRAKKPGCFTTDT